MPPLSAPTSNNVRCVTYLHFCRWPSQKPAASPVTVLVSYILTLNQFLPARTIVESHRIHSGYFWRRFCVFFCFSARAGNRSRTDNLIITSDAHCQLCYASEVTAAGLEPWCITALIPHRLCRIRYQISMRQYSHNERVMLLPLGQSTKMSDAEFEPTTPVVWTPWLLRTDKSGVPQKRTS